MTRAAHLSPVPWDTDWLLAQDLVLAQITAPQSFDRCTFTVNNPVLYVDPTGDDWWNPLSWRAGLAASAAQAVGDLWSSSSWLDKLPIARLNRPLPIQISPCGSQSSSRIAVSRNAATSSASRSARRSVPGQKSSGSIR